MCPPALAARLPTPARPRLPASLIFASLCLLLTTPGSAQEAGDGPASAGTSPRNANYTIEATLDPATARIQGTVRLRWRNIQEVATDQLYFHLYWNGWRNTRSTWLLEDRIRGRSSLRGKPRPEAWAYQQISTAQLLGETPVDLTPTLRFGGPQSDNPEDRTVFGLQLPSAVEPGTTIEVELEFESKVPRTFARTGHRGDFYFVAHWFPKLGVFEGADGWNCRPFHSATEFYSDYGNYEVTLTLPQRFVVGATGRRVQREEQGDGSVRHRFVQEDVHGFAWTASPDYLDLTERFEEPGLPPVEMRLLLQPEHKAQAERHFEATRAALKFYGLWYGPYPYGHVTVVDPAWGSGAAGMEYPTLFTCGTRLLNPPRTGSPEGVTIHEAGHQFWYGLVGNDEFEHAWLDEGLNTFSTARTLYTAFEEPPVYTKRYLSLRGTRGGFFPWRFFELPRNRAVHGNGMDRYRRNATTDDPATPTYRYYPATASTISYSKTALWLHTLERYLGWETLQTILATFFERWRFRHPEPEDFFAIADEISGQDLSWFFDQVHYGSAAFDYSIERAVSEPLRRDGYFEADGGLQIRSSRDSEEGAPSLYRSEVTVRRHGDGKFPVDVLLRFEDGQEVRHRWDGQGRWHLFVEERESPLVHAVVDPERVLLLDPYYTNNSRLVKPRPKLPAYKWGSRWMFWVQDLMNTLTFFV